MSKRKKNQRLDTVDKIKKRITDLESEVDSYKRSHSFRLGQSLIYIYENPLKIFSFGKKFLSATKKVKRSNTPPPKIYLDTLKSNHDQKAKLLNPFDKRDGIYDRTHKLVPILSNQKVVAGIFSPRVKKRLEQDAHILEIRTTSYQSIIDRKIPDIVVIDCEDLKSNTQWRGMGKLGETYRNKDLLRISAICKSNKIPLVLLFTKELKEYPIIAKNLSRFDACMSTDNNINIEADNIYFTSRKKIYEQILQYI